MANNVTVSIIADTSKFNSDMASAASAAQAGFDKMSAGAKKMAADTGVADSSLKGYSASLQSMLASTDSAATGVTKVSTAMKETTTVSAGVTREIIVLGHEMVSGNFSRIPGSLMVLGERMGGLSLATYGVVGAVAVFAGGLAYLAYQAYEAQKALDRTTAAALMFGRGVDATKGFIESQVEALSRMKGVSSDAAREIVMLEVAHTQLSTSMLQQLNQVMPGFVKAYGEKAPEAFEKLVKAMDGLSKDTLPAVDKEFLNLNADQFQVINGLLQANDKAGALAQVFTVLAARAGVSLEGIPQKIRELDAELVIAERSMAFLNLTTEEGAMAYAALVTQIEKLKAARAGLVTAGGGGDGADKDHDYKLEQQFADGLNRTLDERGNLLRNIARLENDIAEAKRRGDTSSQGSFSTALAAEQKKLADLNKRGQSGQPNDMQVYRDELNQQLMAERNFFADSKQEERAFWTAKLALTEGGSKTQLAVRQQIYGLDKQIALQGRADSIASIQAQMKSDQDYFNSKANNVKMQFDLGRINATQELAQLREIAGEEYAQLQRDLNEKMQFYNQDKVAQDRVLIEKEQAQRDYHNKVAQLDQQAALHSVQQWRTGLQPISTAFSGMLQGMLQGTQTFKQTMTNVAQNIALAYAEMGIQAVIEWTAHQGAMLFASIAADQGIVASKEAAAIESKAIETTAAEASIVKSAATAAARAYEAVVGIYLVGPVLAPIAAAVAFAGVMAFGNFSAAGGFDIPAGVNPVTQLHQQEMVLPADLANRVRGMTDSGAGGDVHLHVHATDAQSVRRLFMDNKAALGQALRGAVRDGSLSFRPA